MDYFEIMKILGFIVTVFVFYRLMVYERRDKTKGHYTRPAWNFFLKKLYAEYKIKQKQKRNQLRVENESNRYEIEAPKILPNEDSSDSQQIYGTDQEGNSLLIKFTRRRHRVAELWLIMRLSNGHVYTFADHPNTKIVNATPRIFEGSGLKLECLRPYSKWRITFSGMLRRGIAQDITDSEENLHFVRMNFIWTTASNPVFWPNDWSPKLIATSLATEKWRDGKWMQLMTKKDSGGYDQYGSCAGEVKVYDQDQSPYVEGMLPKIENFELNLPGIRQRRWGPHKNQHLHRTGVLLGSIENGCAFEVGAFSHKYGLTHSQFGNVLLPNGDIYPIDWTDFNLAALGEYQNHLPEATIVMIQAKKLKLTVMVNFKNNTKVPLYGGTQNESWNAFIVSIEIKFNTLNGRGVAIFWYPKNIREFDIQEIPTKIKRIFNRKDLPCADKLLMSFADKEAQSVFVSGGKGSSLAIMRVIQETKGKDFLDKRDRSQQIVNALIDQVAAKPLKKSFRVEMLMKEGVPQRGRQRSGSLTNAIFPDPHDFDVPDYHVPQGFIVSVSAFMRHLKREPQIGKLLLELENVAYERTVGDLKEICIKVQEAFKSSKLDKFLIELITQKLNQINYDGSVRFAVRSSGVTEDNEETSAAGQNETFLGLKTYDDVHLAILKCWASLYSYQSVLYRKQHIQPVVSSMAVVVQKMIAAEAAGVLFTRHPLNGDPSVVVITANYGLGESVVSGKADPDTFFVKRSHKDEVELLGTKAGTKKFFMEMDEEKSTIKESQINEDQMNSLCLSEEIVLKLSHLGVIMEKFFGTPRDIEFAVTNTGKIYLLQSRPITALNNFTDYEIIHENDFAVMNSHEVTTKSNVGEVLPGAMSVLNQSLFGEGMDKAVAVDNFRKKNYFGLYRYVFVISHHHLLMNVTKLMFENASDDPGAVERLSSLSVYGCDIYEKYPQIIDYGKDYRSYVLERTSAMLSVMLASLFKNDERIGEAREYLENVKNKFSRERLEKLKTSSDICDLIENVQSDLKAIGDTHMKTSQNGMLYQMVIYKILAKGANTLSSDNLNDVSLILSSLGNVESANIPEMIREIASTIILSNKQEEFLKVDRKDAVEWLENNCEAAHKIFLNFLKRHGHRGINEMDVISKPWERQPEGVIDMIKLNVSTLAAPSSGKISKTPTTEEIIENLKTPLGSIAKFFMAKLIPRCQKGVRNREITKSFCVANANEMRRGIYYLAEVMMHEGLLPERDLIFHLSFTEIKDIIASRDGKHIAKAFRRQKLFPMLNTLKFPEMSFGVPQALSNDINNNNEAASEGSVLVSGIPVCGGIVTGKACVCKSFADANQIQKGDILVTFGTDTAWSPYFPILGGVCTEIGGIISHGAVVAREYGLPCIIGADSATYKIKHGQKVTLNANNGRITLAAE
ncbi:CLUMA_CG017475, isoform A [Clunio marinus]|uniref:CLUMA_CG017475, isoform A n=1 Tax=Clunio marinus TaxID=568069 RepID=A0A1J1IWA3_9DIPT|nr:CLUMA_CG017475, isoform A [Clunio marinus]